jgi:hypothetical protein
MELAKPRVQRQVMRGSVVNNTNLFRKMLHSNEWNYMFRPAVAIFMFPQTIRFSLYNLCDGVLVKRSLWINPLFALVSSVNRLYTGCNRRNVRDFGRVFLRSNYTDITQNTYIQS